MDAITTILHGWTEIGDPDLPRNPVVMSWTTATEFGALLEHGGKLYVHLWVNGPNHWDRWFTR